MPLGFQQSSRLRIGPTSCAEVPFSWIPPEIKQNANNLGNEIQENKDDMLKRRTPTIASSRCKLIH